MSDSQNISPLKKTGISEQIYEILKSKIASGEWKPGDKILSENELAAQFEVSRMSVRNALQRLAAIGLLETKSGSGTFVKAFNIADYFHETADLIGGVQSMRDIREFRCAFEEDYLILACERRTEEELEELRRLYQEMVTLSEGVNFDAFFNIDMQFHDCICHMAHNQVYDMICNFLHGLLLPQLKDNTQKYAIMHQSSMNRHDDNYVLKVLMKEHKNYVDALEQRDYTLATEQLKHHMETYQTL